MIWLTPVKIAGKELPDDSMWQMDEQVRIQPDDYDKILEMGWSPWLGQYIGRYLREEAAAAQVIMEAGPRWAGEFMKKGYVAFDVAKPPIPSSSSAEAARSRSSCSTCSITGTRCRPS